MQNKRSSSLAPIVTSSGWKGPGCGGADQGGSGRELSREGNQVVLGRKLGQEGRDFKVSV